MSDKPISWDDYAAEHAITKNEAPQAFAAYLHEVTDGEWNGDVEQIDNRNGQNNASATGPPGISTSS